VFLEAENTNSKVFSMNRPRSPN